MHNIVRKLKPAQNEVHQAAHNQDLVEVPRRAQLDRQAEGRTLDPPKLDKPKLDQFQAPDVELTEQNK